MLAVALAVSVAANVTAAEPTVIGRAVAAWPPIALLLVVDVLGKAPVAPGWLGRLAIAATGLVAAVAAVASFTHMRHVALAAGESELVAVLFPLSVDGTAIVCSVALVEINRRTNFVPSPETGSPHTNTLDDSITDTEPIDNEPDTPAGLPVFTGLVSNQSPRPVMNGAGETHN